MNVFSDNIPGTNSVLHPTVSGGSKGARVAVAPQDDQIHG